MEKTEIIFDFTSRFPEGSEDAKTIVSQMPAGGSIVNTYSRVDAVLAEPVKSVDGKVTGIFTETLPDYLYPYLITIDVIYPEGKREKLVSFNHPGGELSLPYNLDEGCLLVLTVLNKESGTYEIRALDKE